MQAAVVESTEGTPSLSRQIQALLETHGAAPRRLRLPKGRLFALSSGSLAGLHVLVGGHLKLLRFWDDGRVMLMDVLGPSDVFGETSVLGAEVDVDAEAAEEACEQTTYVQALSDAAIDSLSPVVVERLVARDPLLTLCLARLMGRRRLEMENRLLRQVFDRVPARLAQRLLGLADRYGVLDAALGGVRLQVLLSQQDLANWIGASREIVSLTLSDFRRVGAVRKHGRILVLDRAKLRLLENGGRS